MLIITPLPRATVLQPAPATSHISRTMITVRRTDLIDTMGGKGRVFHSQAERALPLPQQTSLSCPGDGDAFFESARSTQCSGLNFVGGWHFGWWCFIV